MSVAWAMPSSPSPFFNVVVFLHDGLKQTTDRVTRRANIELGVRGPVFVSMDGSLFRQVFFGQVEGMLFLD